MTIVVVGAGLAGLTAARTLIEQGHSAVVLERRRAPGGRISTRRVIDGEADRPELTSLAFDDGAQYFTVRDVRFEREVERWHKARVVQVWNGVLAAFDSEGRERVEGETTRWVGVPAMSSVPRMLARGLDVRCSTTVTDLVAGTTADGIPEWHALTAEHGALGPFDAAIIAVPAPRAVPLLAAAPELAREAAAVSMHACWSAVVAFDDRVPTAFDAAFVASSALGWIARDRSKPQRGLAETWVLHAAAGWSEAHVNDRADTVGPFLLNAFADLVRGPLPRPVHLSAHRWRYAAADPPTARGALVDVERRLAVCGDWCLGNRLEAAFLSALIAAGAVSAQSP